MRPSRSSQRNNVESDQPSWQQDRAEWREKMDAWREKLNALREERKEWQERGEGWREQRAEWNEARKELMEERKELMEERKEWQEDRKEWREAKREERRKEKEEKDNEDTDSDTGGTDTGDTDTGGTDTGGADTGGTDTGGTDTGGTETGGTDTGGTDTGGTDTGGTDTGGTDTGGTDTGGTDTGGTDTGGTDTGGTDTGGTDTGGTEDPEPPAEPQLFTEYTSSAEGSDFNVHIEFVGEWSIELQNSFVASADYLSSIITGDLMDVMLNGEFVDDITITAELADIDGAGGVLGQAGPTYVRSADYMPVAGMMQFDVADADNFNAMGYWDSIVLHEMTHTLGFGSLWSYKGLANGLGTDNPTFTGANATAVYEKTYGLTDTNGVPIENDGGAGTAGAHWEESLFGTDLMSGYLTAGTQPELSQLSIASLEDMGYDTIFDYDSFMA